MFQGERRKIKTRINLDALKEAIDNVVQKMQIKVMINANIYVILNYTKNESIGMRFKMAIITRFVKNERFSTISDRS
jgi:hypothetical protein